MDNNWQESNPGSEEEQMDVVGEDEVVGAVLNTNQTEAMDVIFNYGDAPDEVKKNDEEEDDSRPRATFRFVLKDVSKVKESALSQPTYVRNLPWKIMIMQRTTNQSQAPVRSVGYFLQCNGDSDSPAWSCNAYADLKLLPQKEGIEQISRKIQHIFYNKENDWGFSHYMAWADLLDPAKGFVKDDTAIFEVTVNADAPHGVCWDSKKHTGFVGLKNQGATCYMNSLLQTLFFTNKLRKAVYQMPTEGDDCSKSVALALQRVFFDLQFCDKPVGTKKLTRSFGWETLDSFMQHDVQELCRVLLDNMESKMKNTLVEGTIPKLFEGKMSSFIRCKHVDFSSSRTEPFYDIQLNIKDKKDIYQSFEDYVAVETLDGDNKYDAGDHGLQEAEKGISFESFPPVLHLHLLRFQYDPLTDANVKINDRFEFPEKLNLDKFLSKPESTPADYTLHAVLVHSGDNHGGHYVVFINPKGDGKWCKFDDDVVSCCNKTDALDHNFGGIDEEVPVKHSTNAYMLVYIRDSALGDVLQPVNKSDIPEYLTERLQEERRQETLRRKERNESHMYINLVGYTEDSLMTHHGTNLFNADKTPGVHMRIPKQSTCLSVREQIADFLNYPPDGVRLWPFTPRADNHAMRPTRIFSESEGISSYMNSTSDISVFVELVLPSMALKPLPVSEKDEHVFLFFKYFNVQKGYLTYCGCGHYRRNASVTDLYGFMYERSGLPKSAQLTLYKEDGEECPAPTRLYPIGNHHTPLHNAIEDLRDGDIIIFHRSDKLPDMVDFRQFFEDLNMMTEVVFCDKNNPNDNGFQLELVTRMKYAQIAEEVALHLGADPNMLQFFKNQSYREGPGCPLRCNYEGTLKDILFYTKPRQPKKIYYQHLNISIHELENKRPFKVTYTDARLKEEEMELYPNKSGTVLDLLNEAKSKIEFSKDSTRELRFMEIISFKITHLLANDIILECLNPTGTKAYRVDEVPKDQLNLEPSEFLLPVAHFNKETYQTFGIPFLLKVKNKETFATIKPRIQKKLEVPDKEFEKFKFALVPGRAQYISDDNFIFNKEDFIIQNNQQGFSNVPRAWLGLDHQTKVKRSRYNYMEKAIKIHN